MIGSIKGSVKYKGLGFVIVDVSGVGYKVFVIPTLLVSLKSGETLELLVHTHVREDQISLFGFQHLEEQEFFDQLIGVSGIGPKSALGIMSLASVAMLKSAIVSEDPSVFTKVSGIGRKTAERVIVELKEKIKEAEGAKPVAREHSEALDALLALGYNQQQAREALKNVPANVTKLQDKIKLALKSFSK